MRIDGKTIASELIDQLKTKVDALKEKGVVPHLFIITFGDDAQTESYLKQKKLRAEQIGAKITIKRFDTNVKASAVYNLLEQLNKDPDINGIIVQRPLPKQLDTEKVSLAIYLPKDVDGFHPHSKFASPVGLAVIKLIESTMKHENIHEFLKTKKITIIGKGTTAGGPTIRLFQNLGLKFNVIDSKTKNTKNILKKSDIVISAVGEKIVKKEDLKKGVILIGIGMHTQDGKLKGDYDETDIEKVSSFYSPTPGGIGPVNVTMLMKNLVSAAEQQFDIIK